MGQVQAKIYHVNHIQYQFTNEYICHNSPLLGLPPANLLNLGLQCPDPSLHGILPSDEELGNLVGLQSLQGLVVPVLSQQRRTDGVQRSIVIAATTTATLVLVAVLDHHAIQLLLQVVVGPGQLLGLILEVVVDLVGRLQCALRLADLVMEDVVVVLHLGQAGLLGGQTAGGDQGEVSAGQDGGNVEDGEEGGSEGRGRVGIVTTRSFAG